MDIYAERGNMVSAVSRHLKNRGLADDVPKNTPMVLKTMGVLLFNIDSIVCNGYNIGIKLLSIKGAFL